jgi:ribokinase
MPTITVIGSFVAGLTMRVPRVPVLGENLVGESFNLGIGGKGTNQAIAAARLGCSVNLVACLGDDLFADMACSVYRAEGISQRFIHRMKGAYSGIGFVTLVPSGDNWITVDLGANLHLSAEQVSAAEDAIAASDVTMTQFEAPPETVAHALHLGRVHQTLTILNPAPARRIDPALLQNVDVLTPNESEARILLGLAPDDPQPTLDVAQQLLRLGVRQLVITRGKHGALIVTPDGSASIAAPTIQAVDPTGAGDSFNASLAAALAEGRPLQAAVEEAVYAGAYTATKLGVIDGLPTRAELAAFRAHLTAT